MFKPTKKKSIINNYIKFVNLKKLNHFLILYLLDYSQLKGPLKFAGVRSPIATDPIYNEGKYSNRSLRPQPRVKPEAAEIADKSQGCMGILFANYGKPDPGKNLKDPITS